ncbi:30S ribosomal chloroplastic-like isoform X1 [Micractinium conductrix]|uniref:30S ribosomal chloroplastic-like isoform X1 n=1 Tax=Micractinium conductrix TaxID=554055 RepID=A0A2P6VDI8_9CHLO|nr:30S ribosomal chloroplastic-like isoform X1 [Micractinium conductrix]|eukprot:PSC72163.1 30S ribosomal chloroplastic-like isoform X1 [Micractinium conductrix]
MAMVSCCAAAMQPCTASRSAPAAPRAVALRPFARSLAAQRLKAAAAAPAAPRRGAVAVQAAAAAPAPQQQKIRIKLKSYWVDLLQDSVEKIREAASSTGATIAGPVPLPTRKKIYTVLRSPHVNKDSREQFEVRLHQRLIDVKDLSSQTVDRLMSLDLPAGVDVEVKL